jgi:hypothetical protein
VNFSMITKEKFLNLATAVSFFLLIGLSREIWIKYDQIDNQLEKFGLRVGPEHTVSVGRTTNAAFFVLMFFLMFVFFSRVMSDSISNRVLGTFGIVICVVILSVWTVFLLSPFFVFVDR